MNFSDYSFHTKGGQYFRINDSTNISQQKFAPQELPSNMEEVDAAQKSTTFVDRYEIFYFFTSAKSKFPEMMMS